MEKRIVNITLS